MLSYPRGPHSFVWQTMPVWIAAHSSGHEDTLRDYDPIERMQKIAELFAVPVTELPDESNLLLYNGQGRQIKKCAGGVRCPRLKRRGSHKGMGSSPIPLLMYPLDRLNQLRLLLYRAGHGFDLLHDRLCMDSGNFLGELFLIFLRCRIMHDNAQRTYPLPWQCSICVNACPSCPLWTAKPGR